jgi:hypothetical protein
MAIINYPVAVAVIQWTVTFQFQWPFYPTKTSLSRQVPGVWVVDTSARDASSKGRLVQWTHRPRDTLSKGHIVQGTEHARLFVRGHIVQGHTSQGWDNIAPLRSTSYMYMNEYLNYNIYCTVFTHSIISYLFPYLCSPLLLLIVLYSAHRSDCNRGLDAVLHIVCFRGSSR